MSLKNPVTPPGIDPETFWLVTQCLNHYPRPLIFECNIFKWLSVLSIELPVIKTVITTSCNISYFTWFLGGSHTSHVPYLCGVEFHIQNFVSQEKKLHPYISHITKHIKMICTCRLTFRAILRHNKSLLFKTTPIPQFDFRSNTREVTVF